MGTLRTRSRCWTGSVAAGAGVAFVLLALRALGGPPASTVLGRPAEPRLWPADAQFALEATWRLPEAPAEPLDLALLPDGTLVVADGRRNAVLVFDADGALRGEWSEPPTGPLPGYVYVPRCVEADGGRDLAYVLWLRYRDDGTTLHPSGAFLDTRRPDGTVARSLLAVPTPQQDEVTDMALDAATGDLWLAGAGRMRRLRMPNGVMDAEMALPPDATRLAVNADGLVAIARPAARAVELRAVGGMPLGGWDLAPNEPLAVAPAASGRFHVLVRAPAASATDPATPLVVSVDPYGGPMSARAAAALGAPVPPPGDWPWAIAVAGGRGALTSGSTMFQVSRYDDAGRAGEPLYGAVVAPAYRPSGEDLSGVAPALSLARTATGELIVLDGRDDHMLTFDGLGRLAGVAVAPDGALDFAVGEDGLFVSTTGDRLLRTALPGASADPATPDWSATCSCDLGGRLATASDVLYVSRPRRGAVAALDPDTGTELRALRLPDSVGLWPSDVAVSADGRLYTSDLVRGQVQLWSDPAAPSVTWEAGLLSGPRRLAVGTLADGARIVAAILADGHVEVHEAADGNLIARFLPRTADGRVLEATDIEVAPDGRLYVGDAAKRALYVFAPATTVPTPPTGPPPATATPSARSCTVRGDKRAAPERVVLGHTTTVTLSLAADCPDTARVIGADIVLVIDRSGSMQGAKLASARAAARAFAEMLDVRYHRLGLASFSDDASVDVPLTDNLPAVIDGLAALRAEGGTDLAAALGRARANLEQFGRSEALPVVVLLSDGRNNDEAPDPLPLARDARSWGVQIYTVGLGGDADAALLREIAGRPEAYFDAPSPSELFPVYGEILRVVLSSLAGNLIVDDPIGETMSYVPGSARPSALVSDDRLRWGRSVLPSSGITLTYELLPERTGCWPTNRGAMADFTDADGERRRFAFPEPTVCVVTPTVTPTAMPSPSPTATPTPVAVYLPNLYRNECVPTTKHADIILLIDTSNSMSGGLLQAAKGAARRFVGLLALPQDRAAVIGFSDTPLVAATLSGDAAALTGAIDSLVTRPGTRIDRALWAATGELRGPRRNPANRGVIVLLSDGGHAGAAADVVDLADEARAMGATLYAIGLGDDADADLLRAVAGSPRRYYHAPTDAQLQQIYAEIAAAIPCR